MKLDVRRSSTSKFKEQKYKREKKREVVKEKGVR